MIDDVLENERTRVGLIVVPSGLIEVEAGRSRASPWEGLKRQLLIAQR